MNSLFLYYAPKVSARDPVCHLFLFKCIKYLLPIIKNSSFIRSVYNNKIWAIVFLMTVSVVDLPFAKTSFDRRRCVIQLSFTCVSACALVTRWRDQLKALNLVHTYELGISTSIRNLITKKKKKERYSLLQR